MRTIKNSIGVSYPIALTLGDARRLQAGVEIEPAVKDDKGNVLVPARTLVEDFGHSDADKLQEQIDRILTLPLLAVDLMYALLPKATREQIPFSQFLGDGADVEPWNPADLLRATQELAELILDFFQGRLAEAAGLRRMIRITSKETQAVILGIEQLSDDQFQLATLAGQLKLEPQDFRPIILALNEPATLTVEQAAAKIETLWKQKRNSAETSGGPTSSDSPASLVLAKSTGSPSEHSASVPPEPSNDPPSVPQPSALSQAS